MPILYRGLYSWGIESTKNTHMGVFVDMVVGRDEDGELIVCHCSAANGVGGCEMGGFVRFGTTYDI